MPRLNKTSIEGKLNFGLGGLSVSQEFSQNEFCITVPEFEETNKLKVTIRGLGLQKNWTVLLINELLGNRCYLQEGEGKPTSKGEWKVVTKFNASSSGAERTIYAIGVKDEDVEVVRKLLDPKNVIKTITDIEEILRNKKIKFQITLGKTLVYYEDETHNKEMHVSSVELNVRVRPGAHEAIITTLRQNSPVKLLGKTSEVEGSAWVKILTNLGEGWVNSRFLKK